MSSLDRSRQALVKFFNIPWSARTRNMTPQICARCRITLCARFCARCRASLTLVPLAAGLSNFKSWLTPDRLTSFKISLQQVFEALEKNNANANGNFIEHKSEQYIVQ